MWRYLIYEASHINFERCAAEGRWLQGVSIHRELPTRGGSPEATDPETCHSPFGSAASLATQGGQPISLGRTPLTTSGVDPLGRRKPLPPRWQVRLWSLCFPIRPHITMHPYFAVTRPSSLTVLRRNITKACYQDLWVMGYVPHRKVTWPVVPPPITPSRDLMHHNPRASGDRSPWDPRPDSGWWYATEAQDSTQTLRGWAAAGGGWNPHASALLEVKRRRPKGCQHVRQIWRYPYGQDERYSLREGSSVLHAVHRELPTRGGSPGASMQHRERGPHGPVPQGTPYSGWEPGPGPGDHQVRCKAPCILPPSKEVGQPTG